MPTFVGQEEMVCCQSSLILAVVKVLVDIHEFMALKLRKVVEEVQQLPEVA